MIDAPGKSPALNARESVTVQPGEILVDARGHQCPVPTLRLQKGLRSAAAGQTVRLLADDPMARIDVPHFLTVKAWPPALIVDQGGWTEFIVATPASPLAPAGQK